MSLRNIRRSLAQLANDMDAHCPCGNADQIILTHRDGTDPPPHPPQCPRCGRPEVVEVREVIVSTREEVEALAKESQFKP